MGTNQVLLPEVIVEGPSKFDLMLALFDGNGRTVTFRTSFDDVLRARIHSVGIEDGSEESWLISGSYPWLDGATCLFEGYYSTRRRTGYLKPVKKS